MEAWLDWARGPAFVFSFSFMLLGLVRHVFLTAIELLRAYSRAGNKTLPSRQVLLATLTWLFPLNTIRKQPFSSIISIAFHVAIIVVPVFLAGHIALWTRGLGIAWQPIPPYVADTLTLLAILTGLVLVLQRALASATRILSRFQDYALPILISIPFATGYLMMHPTVNPLSYNFVFLMHVLSANVLLVLIPLTKLTHMALLPGTQLVSELAWHWPPQAGSKVGRALGKEGLPV